MLTYANIQFRTALGSDAYELYILESLSPSLRITRKHEEISCTPLYTALFYTLLYTTI